MHHRFIAVCAGAVVSAIACLPLLRGLPKGHDWVYELLRIAEFGEAMRAGQFPPAWAGNLYGGYGSPFFLFYAPFFYLVSAITEFVSGSRVASMILALTIFTLLSAVTIYLAGREISASRPNSAAAGARIAMYLYVLNPYLLCDKFLRNSNAEFAGLSLLPLIPLGVLLIRRNPWKGFLVLSMGLALVTTTHNITALSAAAIAVCLSLLLYLPSAPRSILAAVPSGIGLGLVLSAFFWIPALSLLSQVRGKELLSGKFDFHNQFTNPVDVFGYETFYSIGVFPLVALAGVGAALYLGRENSGTDRRVLIGSLGFAGLLVLLMTRHSAMIWEIVPHLPFFEFPWRFLGPFALIVALGGGLAFSILSTNRSPLIRHGLEIAVLALCILNAMPGLLRVATIPPASWDRLEESLQPAAIRQVGLKATVYSEFMPIPSVREAWRNVKPVKGPLLSMPPGLEVSVTRNEPIDIQLDVHANSETELQLGRWFFPGWKAEIDGEPLELSRSELGTLSFKVPAGKTSIWCYFDTPPIRRLGNWLSVLGLLVWLAFLALLAARGRSTENAAAGHVE
jgi:hypothetical protein